MTRVARVAAQAKINLYLRVGPADATGYHAIETVFQRIDLADDVVIRLPERGRSLDVTGPRLPGDGLGPTEKNLAYRAALAYYGAAGWPSTFAIEVIKRIPVGGGLGGGSADAAAVLRSLDTLAPTPMGGPRLTELAATLGADVPFLTSPHVRALGWGRGDQLKAASALPARPVIVVIPPFGVATADAYRWVDEDQAGTLIDSLASVGAAEGVAGDPWSATIDASHNDFQRPVERRHPVLARVRHALREAGADIALLSGSGSTVFGVFRERVGRFDMLPEEMRVVATRTSASVVQVEVLE